MIEHTTAFDAFPWDQDPAPVDNILDSPPDPDIETGGDDGAQDIDVDQLDVPDLDIEALGANGELDTWEPTRVSLNAEQFGRALAGLDTSERAQREAAIARARHARGELPRHHVELLAAGDRRMPPDEYPVRYRRVTLGAEPPGEPADPETTAVFDRLVAAAAPAAVDPATGEELDGLMSVWPTLPDAFWTSRSKLAHIRQAAHERLVPADAVLAHVLARVCVVTPYRVQSPAIVGGPGSLNVIFSPVGPSSSGKSASDACAADLLPLDSYEGVRHLPPGSGEGMVDAFFKWVKDEDDGRRTIPVRSADAVLFTMDEGQSLVALGERAGQTTLPTIRSMWAGREAGASYKSSKDMQLRPHGYRTAFVVAIQPEHADAILRDAAGGTPQRFVWLSAVDPTIPAVSPGWPGPVPFHPVAMRPEEPEQVLHLDDGVHEEIRLRRLGAVRGQTVAASLDGHRDYNRLKVAGLLALLDDRMVVSADDWRLAGMVMDTSDRVRNVVLCHVHELEAKKEQAATARAIRRRAAVQDADEERQNSKLLRLAATIGRAVHKRGGLTMRDAKKALTSTHRDHFGDALDLAVTERWVRLAGKNLEPGEHDPSA